MLSKRYKSTEVDRRTWLHVPSGTPWSKKIQTCIKNYLKNHRRIHIFLSKYIVHLFGHMYFHNSAYLWQEKKKQNEIIWHSNMQKPQTKRTAT